MRPLWPNSVLPGEAPDCVSGIHAGASIFGQRRHGKDF